MSTTKLSVLFGRKPIQMERAILDALDINFKFYTNGKSIGDGFVRQCAFIKTHQLDLLRMYTKAVDSIEGASDEDKEMLKRLMERWQENYNQCLSLALAGAIRMGIDSQEESMFDEIRGVTQLQNHLDLLILEIAKYKQLVINNPEAVTKLSSVLSMANHVLGEYPVVLGYLNALRTSRYEVEESLSQDAGAYVKNLDDANDIRRALVGQYSEVGIAELTERVKNDVNWYTKMDERNFMPSDGCKDPEGENE